MGLGGIINGGMDWIAGKAMPESMLQRKLVATMADMRGADTGSGVATFSRDAKTGAWLASSKAAREIDALPATQQVLQGIFDLGGDGLPARIDSIVLTREPDGLDTVRVLEMPDILGWKIRPLLLSDTMRRQAIGQTLANFDPDTVAQYRRSTSGGTMAFGPAASASLLELPGSTVRPGPGLDPYGDVWEAATTALHERHHAVTPSVGADIDWFEEGTATFLSRAPGQTEAALRSLGATIDGPMSPGHLPATHPEYMTRQSAVHALTHLAGMPTRTPADVTVARQALQARPATEAYNDLVGRIVAAHDIDRPVAAVVDALRGLDDADVLFPETMRNAGIGQAAIDELTAEFDMITSANKAFWTNP